MGERFENISAVQCGRLYAVLGKFDSTALSALLEWTEGRYVLSMPLDEVLALWER